ncbi:MAG TPA: tyrosine-type recombinase/integrase [Terriglobales bacterium]|nr:tyrosine-type recombinase/integrase [Terriglobales bacterium]
MIRKSLDLRSWDTAQKLVRDWEANPNATVTVSEACDKFIKEQKDRELSESFIRKLKNVTDELKEKFGSVSLRSVTVDELRGVKQGWKLALVTKQKRVEMLRMFFEFCVNSGWVERNPAKVIKIRGVNVRPTLPFSETEMEQIFWACEVIRETHPQMKPGIEKKLRALVLLMRHSGLRISDAVICTEDRIRDGKLFLYRAKTDEPVWVPLPQIVLDALAEIKEQTSPYYFWTGKGKLRHAPTEWQDRLKKLFTLAGVYDPASHNQSHRLRDTFACRLLEKGVSLEIVSMLLGHKNIATTQKHYAPWVRERQVALEAAVQAALK